MKKLIAALGLIGLLGCSNTPTCIPYCKQKNKIIIPQTCSKDLIKEYKVQNKDNQIRVYELDRNKDKKTDLAFLLTSNKNGCLMILIEDKNFDGLVENIYVDVGSKEGVYKPDKIYDFKASAKAVCKDILKKEPNKKNLNFNQFLQDYLDFFE